MVFGTFFALAILPSLFEVAPVTGQMGIAVLMGAGISLVLAALLEQIRKLYEKKLENRRVVRVI